MDEIEVLKLAKSISNPNPCPWECCYTYDFPAVSDEMQKKMHFFYGAEEKAYKTCIEGVKKAYPGANYTIMEGHGHLTCSMENTEAYLEMMRKSATAECNRVAGKQRFEAVV